MDIPKYNLIEHTGPLMWVQCPEKVKEDFTLNNAIPVFHDFRTDDSNTIFTWSRQHIVSGIYEAKQRGMLPKHRTYNEPSVIDLYNVLDKYPVTDKDALVIGSEHPWIEVILLAFGAKSVTTVDFKPINCEAPELITTITVDQLKDQYDVIFSYSSIEHDGLGRYGDPIHPFGDILRMNTIKNLLKPNGTLYLGVPTGKDALYYNIHRVYGNIRFPLLTEGWDIIDTFRCDIDKTQIFTNDQKGEIQPWFVMKLKV